MTEDEPTHLHGVGLPRARLSVGEDADVEAVDARGHQGLDLLEHLGTEKDWFDWFTGDGKR